MQPHPKWVFKGVSVLFTILGLSYLFFPSWNASIVFGRHLLTSAAPYTHMMMQCLGGACILLASTFCTASENVTENLCKSVSFGFFINAAIKAFSLISGWSGDVRKGAYETSLPAYTALFGNIALGVLMWWTSKHPDVIKTGLYPTHHEAHGRRETKVQ